jgi:tRNA-dihydrouridine synthase
MGCPAKNVSEKGAGAGLILQPKLAQEIVRAVQKATEDWNEGITLEKGGIHEDVISFVEHFENNVLAGERKLLPVSVKTRIGYDKPVIEEWISTLLEVEPVNISLHGRTLKQMYTGLADWDEIGKAAELIHKTSTTIIGNGDVHTREEALKRITDYKLDGVLIGRAAFGNPWVFQGEEVDMKTKLNTALLHTQQFLKMTPEQNFLSLRKHLAWYCKGFPNATELRAAMVRVNTPEDIEQIIASHMPQQVTTS